MFECCFDASVSQWVLEDGTTGFRRAGWTSKCDSTNQAKGEVCSISLEHGHSFPCPTCKIASMSRDSVDPYLALEIKDERVFKSHSLMYQAPGGGGGQGGTKNTWQEYRKEQVKFGHRLGTLKATLHGPDLFNEPL